MMVRLFRWTEWDVYRYFNADHKDYPNLPPPPNPAGLQAFMVACVDVTIEQMSRENDPNASKRGGDGGGGRPPRRRV